MLVSTQSRFDVLMDKGTGMMDRQESKASTAGSRVGHDGGESGTTEQPGERAVRLDEIKLAIGDAFQIQAQTEQTEARYYVKLIGYLRGKSVLVTMPEADGAICYVREGQAFVVRFFSGKNAYAFTANVLRSSSIPFPHMHLGYPPLVRGLIIRVGERVPVRIICAIILPEGTRTVTAAGLLTNLSVSGAMVSSKTRLGSKGDPLLIKFRVDIREIEFVMSTDATIRSVSQDTSGGFLHGVEFAGMTNDAAIALTAFVYQKLADPSR
ncbi:MAG TPA: flagellar brake protein [Candidatus Accumulibacter phosphatis]|nr:flagellar brake protein [Accumulibacter sp.]HRF12948.1 flagellar brake protein [Candidatus Accumulibacter phosphatis]